MRERGSGHLSPPFTSPATSSRRRSGPTQVSAAATLQDPLIDPASPHACERQQLASPQRHPGAGRDHASLCSCDASGPVDRPALRSMRTTIAPPQQRHPGAGRDPRKSLRAATLQDQSMTRHTRPSSVARAGTGVDPVPLHGITVVVGAPSRILNGTKANGTEDMALKDGTRSDRINGDGDRRVPAQRS